MHCKLCGGRAFIDRVFSQKMRVELFCLMCGKRWIIKKDGNVFAEWLINQEKKLARKSCIFT